MVGLALAVGLHTISIASEAQQADVQSESQTSLPAQAPVDTTNRTLSSALTAPLLLPTPEPRINGPLVIEEHLAPPPGCEDGAAHPTYCVYTVQSGDTLSGIAQRFQMSGNGHFSAVEMLALSNKPDVVSSDEIVPGQKLRIPARTGIVITLLSAKTLSEIAAGYGVSADSIIAVPENGLSAGGEVVVGQELLIPDPRQLPVAAAPQALPTVAPQEVEEPETVEPPAIETPEPENTPVPTATPQPTATPRPVDDDDEPTPRPTRTPRSGTPSPTPTPRPDRPAGQSKYGFIWPVWGNISSYFGPSHPLGIDIDLYEDPNAPIAAAKAGIVTFAGGNACCSYGLYVVIDHGDGTSTLYAHLSQIAVSQGQLVTQGQLLGYGGKTGYATGNHLHFEVRIGDAVVDPLLFLP